MADIPTLHDGDPDDHIGHPHLGDRCMGDAGLPTDHREALDRLARLRVLLGEMKVSDPSGEYGLDRMFGKVLATIEGVVRHHGQHERLLQAEREAQQTRLDP